MHTVEMYWLVLPNYAVQTNISAGNPHALAPSVVDVLALVGFIGAFLAVVFFNAAKRPLVPVGTPAFTARCTSRTPEAERWQRTTQNRRSSASSGSPCSPWGPWWGCASRSSRTTCRRGSGRAEREVIYGVTADTLVAAQSEARAKLSGINQAMGDRRGFEPPQRDLSDGRP